jgi:hypothetical protein
MTRPGQVPPAFQRVGVPRGATVTVRAKRADTPILTVEAPDGTDLLTMTTTQDGLLDVQCDETRLTEAARLFLDEVRQLLGLRTRDPFVRIATENPETPPRQP